MLEGYTTFSQAEAGQTFERPVYVADYTQGSAKNGEPFLTVTMLDGKTSQQAKLFSTSAARLENELGVTKQTVADVKIDVSIYNGAKSFTIKDIRPCADTSLSASDFAKLPPLDIDQMYDEICRIIKDLPNPKPDKTPLSKPALALLEEHKEKFKTSSAAVYMHHNYKGGLIYHTYRMVKAAAAMCEIYKELDKEILVCATALHDLGKINEHNTDPVGNAETTELAALYGHLYLGAMFFSNKCAQITGCDKERQRLLTHCILAHHGQGEWGAVRTPATPEAFALHYIDNLDAKIESCNIMYEQTQPGKSTEKKLAGFDRLYKPTYFDND